ncbi:unnamed protein product, partial [Rotaria sp. Silwood1]
MSIVNKLNKQVYHQPNQQWMYQPTRRQKQLHQMIQHPMRSPTAL